MNEVPFFSVIVPTHNAEAYIRKGLDSIRDQHFKDYELIVVCDSCKDRTAEIAREYTDKVIEVEYGRDGLARNAGIDAAAGTWLLFMDDDDWFLHEYVFTMLSHTLELIDLDILLFDFIWKGKGYATQESRRFIAVWNKVWRREYLGNVRFNDKQFVSDVDFNEDAFKMSPRVGHVAQPFYYYNYMREGSLSWALESMK